MRVLLVALRENQNSQGELDQEARRVPGFGSVELRGLTTALYTQPFNERGTLLSQRIPSSQNTQGGSGLVSLRSVLTDKQCEELKQAFTVLDSNGTGNINLRDLRVALRAIGFEPRKEDVDLMLESLGISKSYLCISKVLTTYLILNLDPICKANISFKSFMDIVAYKLDEKGTGEELARTFRLFTDPKRNVITVDSLKHVVEKIGEDVTVEELKEMMEEADLDGNGVVDLNEFIQMMRRARL
ncbi:hypothetical protein GJ496_002700 [Pomphorhynchus laevis]|nr:hypothetical protein GJ496_002700 [Pomphorhynchus laevis]